jgi:hypothetical protein
MVWHVLIKADGSVGYATDKPKVTLPSNVQAQVRIVVIIIIILVLLVLVPIPIERAREAGRGGEEI